VPDALPRALFQAVRLLFFELRLRKAHDYADRDRAMAMYAPVALLVLAGFYQLLTLLGFMAIYWALGVDSWRRAFAISGSSILTLGFAAVDDLPKTAIAFAEATIGLMLIALVISYLPTMYAAFSRRESAVTMLEVRAGTPPSAVELIKRYHRIHGFDRL